MGIRAQREMEDRLAGALRGRAGLPETRRLHGRVVALGLTQSNFLAAKLVLAYAAAAEIAYATAVFNQVARPNTFLFNAMIRAFAHNRRHADAVQLYKAMLLAPPPVAADRFTLPFILRSCAALILPLLGQQVHAQACRLGLDSVPAVGVSLLEMYAKSTASHSAARRLFDEMPHRDALAWTVLLSAHARRGQVGEAALLFDAMPEKTAISWTALISGYAAAGDHAAALEAFRRMQLSGMTPDYVTLISILPSCACLGAMETGRWIHAFASRNGLLGEIKLCNALVEMYAKCGSMNEARQMFDRMPRRDVVSWTTMIGGLARHGRAAEAVELFEAMKNSGEAAPNGVTLLAVLSACAHAGLAAKGQEIFSSMTEAHGVRPGAEHYGCLVDLLGRAGQFRSALAVIDDMPMRPDAAVWGSLLGACRNHGNAEVAAVAAERLLELEPGSAGNCVLVSNVYAAARRWDGVARLRKMIHSRNVIKTPGCSSIEAGNVVKEFVAGQNSGPEFSAASAVLELLASQIGPEDGEEAVGIGDHG